MTFSNPQVYLQELARPLCERFENEPTSYDLAFASCIILYHFADVVGRVRKIPAPKAADWITKIVPEFALIRALANAGKHGELEYHPNSQLIGLRAEHFVHGGAAAFKDGTYFSDGTTFADMPGTVVVTTPDKVTHDVLYTCLRVLEQIENSSELIKG